MKDITNNMLSSAWEGIVEQHINNDQIVAMIEVLYGIEFKYDDGWTLSDEDYDKVKDMM